MDVHEWAKRFYENLDPEPKDMGFDGIPEGKSSDSEQARLHERLACLKERIEKNKDTPSSSTTDSILASTDTLHIVCPPNRWKDMEVKPDAPCKSGKKYDMWNRNDKDGTLVLMRHMYYELTLKYATYFESYFSDISEDKEADIRTYFFWLIEAEEAPFVYAILKSSMFKAWYELTAHTDGGEGHLTVGMWDTFPLRVLTNLEKNEITRAGKQLFERKSSSRDLLDELVDGLFVPNTPLDDIQRKQRLREMFEAAYKNIDDEMANLVSNSKKS